ncbi:hypothetical protein GCM10010251_95890 [Streptomyces aurantiogriseus]|uniref:Uncharacterized protein n=1 Tax=Streptomyces aurantiogriseus TaxID=66870 RepID=A0A918FPI7_9ACTN|nr:hypothetical protein GCM10010251_95890 [Streptomyces aurantiogriseus]
MEDLPCVAGEGWGAGEQFVDQAAQRVQVAGRVQAGVAASLFGGHVRRGADGVAGHGQGVSGGVAEACDAEVAQQRPPVVGDEHVGRFDVAMYDTGAVGGEQSLADVVGPGHSVGDSGGADGGDGAQRSAGDEIHDEISNPLAVEVGTAVVVNRDDVRMRQPGCDACFPAEAGLVHGARLGHRDDFEGDVVATLDVFGVPDLSYAALADDVDQPVAARHRGAAHQILLRLMPGVCPPGRVDDACLCAGVRRSIRKRCRAAGRHGCGLGGRLGDYEGGPGCCRALLFVAGTGFEPATSGL